ncbi:hypothetical protein O987_13205 [Comamonas testosteroni TK102]|uniref:Uncharacterized protein n=1 Tax=Comamonas testosteroni TK102 TaxID=1392005 RepID=A0A076PIZ8_COMTE|nr:hypothetical protein O987_13205 [Comamonas testosteroni TK102]
MKNACLAYSKAGRAQGAGIGHLPFITTVTKASRSAA